MPRASFSEVLEVVPELQQLGGEPKPSPKPRHSSGLAEVLTGDLETPKAGLELPEDVEGQLSSMLGGQLQPPKKDEPADHPPVERRSPMTLEELEVSNDGELQLDHMPFQVRRREAQELGPKGELVLGIDLGTTYSCAAVVQDGQSRVLATRNGPPTLPSAVSLAKGKTFVGDTALSRLSGAPGSTIVGSKRLMGRTFSSPVVQEVKSHFAYEVVAGLSGEAAVKVGSEVVALEEIAAIILEELKISASLQLDGRLNRAVITCPAHFNERQRQAVRVAGQLAGFHVERVLNEPTAAALYFGEGAHLKNRKALVYDLGGGTFDVSLLAIDGDTYQVLATGGDTFLGGVDFDACIADLLCEAFLEQEHIDPRQDPGAVARLMQFAEQAKRNLTEQDNAVVHIEHLVVQPFAARGLTLALRRERIEEMWSPLVDQTISVVRDVCDRGGVLPEAVDDVIMVGGQSRAPIVRRAVQSFFGRAPKLVPRPEEAVALGAARLGNSIAKEGELELIDALPLSIGVGLPAGRFRKIIERDTRLPATKTCTLRTTKRNQKRFEVFLFQGEAETIEGNEPIGSLVLHGLPKGEKGAVRVELKLEVDSESILHVSITEPTTRKSIRAQLGTSETSEEIRSKLGLPPTPSHEDMKRRKGQIGRPKGVWSWLTRLFQ